MTNLVTTSRKKPGPKASIEKTVQRFWSKVDQSTGRYGCWMWQGFLSEKGYGKFNFFGKNKRAHRIAFELEFGFIPEGLLICHICDNPACCNPWHLVAATAKQNTEDMIYKGRANFYNNLPNLRGKQ
jgi:hypothetical protein